MEAKRKEMKKDRLKLWIARDKDGNLFLYGAEPIVNKYFKDRFEIYGSVGNGAIRYLGKMLFPSITWENSPQEVEIKLCNDNTLDILKEKLSKMKSLHPEFAKIIEEDFWNLVF